MAEARFPWERQLVLGWFSSRRLARRAGRKPISGPESGLAIGQHATIRLPKTWQTLPNLARPVDPMKAQEPRLALIIRSSPSPRSPLA